MNIPYGAFDRFVRKNAAPVEVSRRDTTEDGNYGSGLPYNSIGDRNLLIASIEEVRQSTAGGDIQSRSLVAYATTDVDVQVNDRIEYQGDTLEIVASENKPHGNDAAFVRYELQDV